MIDPRKPLVAANPEDGGFLRSMAEWAVRCSDEIIRQQDGPGRRRAMDCGHPGERLIFETLAICQKCGNVTAAP